MNEILYIKVQKIENNSFKINIFENLQEIEFSNCKIYKVQGSTKQYLKNMADSYFHSINPYEFYISNLERICNWNKNIKLKKVVDNVYTI